MASDSTSLRFLVTVTPGLERWLEQELAELGVAGRVLRGGVEARGSMERLWRVNVWSRLAESVRVRMKPFVAMSFSELERGLARLPWHAYLSACVTPRISVTCRRSRLYHSDAVAERTLRAITARLGSGDAAHGGATVFVRIEQDRVQASIDASGELLHRRGYRTHVGEAPLRETLASALVRMADEALHSRTAGGDEPVRLWDPFCGSASIPIEWLALRRHEPPGARRRFAFEQWPIHDRGVYADWLARARAVPKLSGALPPWQAFGSDASSEALRAAQHNAHAAGVADACRFIHADFEQAASQIPTGALVVTNPPYGVRLGRAGLDRALARFERLLLARTDLRPVVMACGFAPYLEGSRLGWERAAQIKVGGLPVRLIRLGSAP